MTKRISFVIAASVASVVALGALASTSRADWSTDSSCEAINAPSLPNDYLDWWQACSTSRSRGGFPSWSPSPPACAPRQWTAADGTCVAMTCPSGEARIAPCAPLPKGARERRFAAVRLDGDGCHAVVERPNGDRDVYAVPKSTIACSAILRRLGKPVAESGLRAP